MTIAPLTARRSARLNGHSSASDSASFSQATTAAVPASSDSGSDESTDSPTSAPLLSHESGGASLVDPRRLQRRAVNGARQLKNALVDAEAAAAKQKAADLKSGLEGVDLVRGVSGSVSVEGSEEWKWGRAMNDDWLSAALAALMMGGVPFVVLLMLHSCRVHQCSIYDSLHEAATQGQSRISPPLCTARPTSSRFPRSSPASHVPSLWLLCCAARCCGRVQAWGGTGCPL